MGTRSPICPQSMPTGGGPKPRVVAQLSGSIDFNSRQIIFPQPSVTLL
jgi:hypothetical protein